jgi:alginate O-acetyltransferase complex protein AlgI
MVFSSITFIFFLLPLFLIFNFIALSTKSSNLRNTSLLFVSLLFYTWGEAYNVLILVVLGFINFIAGRWLHNTKKPRFWLIMFLVFNVGLLVGYKYTYWLLSFFLPAFVGRKQSMPLGISFFTFHAISYLIDVYRRHVQPARSASAFLTYFCMFPHLVAGPIVRYAQIKGDLYIVKYDKDLLSFGLYRFLIGLNKKVIIANSVAVLADSAFTFSKLGTLNVADAWVGISAYAIQIYFDFSGYSDMAIGLAAMAGFRFEENFMRPYSSRSIKEFWQRWHISLSSWLKDYVYIPLGGSKCTNFATYRNLLIVFILCGIWHGANFTFLIWGLWHGFFLVIERLPVVRVFQVIPTYVSRLYTVIVVIFGWIFFRADSITAARSYFLDLFTGPIGPMTLTYHLKALYILIISVLVCIIPDKYVYLPTSQKKYDFSIISYLFQICIGIYSISILLYNLRNPFIYFNF